MEYTDEVLGTFNGKPAIRALGAVLGDLADIGYDAKWAGVRASDAGAPHQRFRVFITAYPSGGGQSLPTPTVSDQYTSNLSSTQQKPGSMHSVTLAQVFHKTELFEVPDSALLRSPTASQGEGGALGEAEARKRGNTVGIRDQAMDLAKLQGYKVSREADNLFPTPKALDGVKGNLKTSQERLDSGHQVDLPNIAIDLLGTPRTSSANGSTPKQVAAGAPKARIEDQVLTTNWGKFEPAIRRWEATIGRPAPEPTKPDGKEGNHRLSSKFTEWMMGLPDGWITDIGLKRNDELKACGNGVVPQQAELALSLLGIKEILERS
jgi:DNA (cytosine-5)-methyltransferase 1